MYFMHFIEAKVPKLNNASIFVSRTGYTGEDGFELSIDTKDIN